MIIIFVRYRYDRINKKKMQIKLTILDDLLNCPYFIKNIYLNGLIIVV